MNLDDPMRNIRRSRADWDLFLRAYPLVWFIRIALWLRPYPKIHAWATKTRTGHEEKSPLTSQGVYKIVWAVSAAARRVPKATCLTQALATQIMLARRGLQSTLHFGAKKNGEKLDAHAWIERNGKILIGFNDTFSELSHFSTAINDASKFHENGG